MCHPHSEDGSVDVGAQRGSFLPFVLKSRLIASKARQALTLHWLHGPHLHFPVICGDFFKFLAQFEGNLGVFESAL